MTEDIKQFITVRPDMSPAPYVWVGTQLQLRCRHDSLPGLDGLCRACHHAVHHEEKRR